MLSVGFFLCTFHCELLVAAVENNEDYNQEINTPVTPLCYSHLLLKTGWFGAINDFSCCIIFRTGLLTQEILFLLVNT